MPREIIQSANVERRPIVPAKCFAACREWSWSDVAPRSSDAVRYKVHSVAVDGRRTPGPHVVLFYFIYTSGAPSSIIRGPRSARGGDLKILGMREVF